MTRVVIVGAGGQARETAWIVAAAYPTWEVCGFVVTDLSRLGPLDSRERVLGDYLETTQTDALVVLRGEAVVLEWLAAGGGGPPRGREKGVTAAARPRWGPRARG